MFIKPGTFDFAADIFCFSVRFCCFFNVIVLYICYNVVYLGLA